LTLTFTIGQPPSQKRNDAKVQPFHIQRVTIIPISEIFMNAIGPYAFQWRRLVCKL